MHPTGAEAVTSYSHGRPPSVVIVSQEERGGGAFLMRVVCLVVVNSLQNPPPHLSSIEQAHIHTHNKSIWIATSANITIVLILGPDDQVTHIDPNSFGGTTARTCVPPLSGRRADES